MPLILYGAIFTGVNIRVADGWHAHTAPCHHPLIMPRRIHTLHLQRRCGGGSSGQRILDLNRDKQNVNVPGLGKRSSLEAKKCGNFDKNDPSAAVRQRILNEFSNRAFQTIILNCSSASLMSLRWLLPAWQPAASAGLQATWTPPYYDY